MKQLCHTPRPLNGSIPRLGNHWYHNFYHSAANGTVLVLCWNILVILFGHSLWCLFAVELVSVPLPMILKVIMSEMFHSKTCSSTHPFIIIQINIPYNTHLLVCFKSYRPIINTCIINRLEFILLNNCIPLTGTTSMGCLKTNSRQPLILRTRILVRCCAPATYQYLVRQVRHPVDEAPFYVY